MRGKKKRYTFVLEFLGGTYVRQASGESPELALRAWLRAASEEDFEWASQREQLLRALGDEAAVPIEGCQNVWCASGVAGDHLFLIHIIGTESGSDEGKQVAEAQMERMGADPKRWGLGDRW
ncbi:MAG: hypothetical protein ABSD13_05480 [Candidatus Korobacteraceae bacterium]|jgi:hypothetical protein